MDYSNPNDPWFHTGYDPFKGLNQQQRMRAGLYGCAFMILCFMLGILLCMLMGSCTTPRAVEEHHHHHYEADTAAVRAQVDAQLSSWHEDMTQYFQQKMEQYTSQQQQSEHQQETITETVTETVDSLGNKIRQEQRTITRDITRELQQQEQRITQEYEQRLIHAIDSVSALWSQTYDSLSSHLTSDISHQTSSTPVGDTRPWYQRLWDNFRNILIAAVLLAIILLTRPLWQKLFVKSV